MYGSTFAARSPGRNPSRSPASTAGRVRMMRPTCLSLRAATASAIARYVFPVPAGPIPNVTVERRIASTNCFCVTVFGAIFFPRRRPPPFLLLLPLLGPVFLPGGPPPPPLEPLASAPPRLERREDRVDRVRAD